MGTYLQTRKKVSTDFQASGTNILVKTPWNINCQGKRKLFGGSKHIQDTVFWNQGAVNWAAAILYAFQFRYDIGYWWHQHDMIWLHMYWPCSRCVSHQKMHKLCSISTWWGDPDFFSSWSSKKESQQNKPRIASPKHKNIQIQQKIGSWINEKQSSNQGVLHFPHFAALLEKFQDTWFVEWRETF